MQLKDNYRNWETGRKDGISTAISSNSLVWFTIGNGILTETYFPSCDTISLHSLRFFVNCQIDESQLPYETSVEDESAPLYKTRTRYEDLIIEKEFVSDHDASVVYVQYRFSKKTNGTFKIFPFINKVISFRNREIILRNENCIILILTDFDFMFEMLNDFVLLNSNGLISACLTLVFGKTEEELNNNKKKIKSFIRNRDKFARDWRIYLNSLNVSGKSTLYKRSIITLKCMEDKKHRGAAVASLALPWGSKFPLSERNGYHLVWVRDLFFASLAFISAGDTSFASDSLAYMIHYLMRPDGSFKQNAILDGEERWNTTQMDQVALPIILAERTGSTGLLKELTKSINYITIKGPYTEQERWEELGGLSPYSIALQARALMTFFKFTGDTGYYEKAMNFLNYVREKTLSVKGKFEDFYFVRITSDNADSGLLELKGELYPPNIMVSTDFLYLVFTGFYPFFDARIEKTVQVVDRFLRVDTGKGVSFYRYNGDVYGFDSIPPKGRLWVLLTAERGIFEYMKGDYKSAFRYLESVEGFATKTFLLPEQVFEDGMASESATPLAWSHAKYIILYDILFHNKKVDFSNPFI